MTEIRSPAWPERVAGLDDDDGPAAAAPATGAAAEAAADDDDDFDRAALFTGDELFGGDNTHGDTAGENASAGVDNAGVVDDTAADHIEIDIDNAGVVEHAAADDIEIDVDNAGVVEDAAADDIEIDVKRWRWIYAPVRAGAEAGAGRLAAPDGVVADEDEGYEDEGDGTLCVLRAQFSRRVVRRVERLNADGRYESVDTLEVGGVLWTGFDDFETVESDFVLDLGAAAAAGVDVELPFAVDGALASEEIRDVAGELRGRLVRERAMVFGRLIARVRRFDDSASIEVELEADLVAGAALLSIQVDRQERRGEASAPVALPSNVLRARALELCATRPEEPKRVLVVGAGNIFCGDAAFGVEVARLLMRETWEANVEIAELGPRGSQLAYRLLDPPDLIVVVDLCARGGPPGTLYVLDVVDDTILGPTGAGVTSLVATMRALVGDMPPVVVVGCEPAAVAEGTALSSAVASSLAPAVSLVKSVVARRAAAGRRRALDDARPAAL